VTHAKTRPEECHKKTWELDFVARLEERTFRLARNQQNDRPETAKSGLLARDLYIIEALQCIKLSTLMIDEI
jgi:hypothetical protein